MFSKKLRRLAEITLVGFNSKHVENACGNEPWVVDYWYFFLFANSSHVNVRKLCGLSPHFYILSFKKDCWYTKKHQPVSKGVQMARMWSPVCYQPPSTITLSAPRGVASIGRKKEFSLIQFLFLLHPFPALPLKQVKFWVRNISRNPSFRKLLLVNSYIAVEPLNQQRKYLANCVI